MKSPLIRELKPNETATAVFLVHSKEIRQKRTGEPYLSLLLGDRSGEIDAKMWDNVAEVMDTFDRDNFIKIKGLMQLYNNRSQLTIHRLRRVEDSEVDFRDFFPASQRDPEVMWSELGAMVSGIGNQHIRLLLNAFLDDPDIASRYRIAPAAKTIHHAFRSGLLEHVLSLCNLAKVTAAHYPNVDSDLLLAGCVLHDIGKIYELTYERGFGYSAEGQLIGHITIAIRMMEEKLRAFPEFPVQLRNLLEHMILSHHGQLDFGSPKVPAFPEALLLHYLDDMDSKMECMRALIEKDPHADTEFTGYSSALARVALRKERYLAPDSSPAEAGVTEAAKPARSADSVPPVLHSPNNGSADDFDAVTKTAVPPASSLFGAKLQQALHPERT
jgi:3'-5' exoribonuclease